MSNIAKILPLVSLFLLISIVLPSCGESDEPQNRDPILVEQYQQVKDTEFIPNYAALSPASENDSSSRHEKATPNYYVEEENGDLVFNYDELVKKGDLTSEYTDFSSAFLNPTAERFKRKSLAATKWVNSLNTWEYLDDLGDPDYVAEYTGDNYVKVKGWCKVVALEDGGLRIFILSYKDIDLVGIPESGTQANLFESIYISEDLKTFEVMSLGEEEVRFIKSSDGESLTYGETYHRFSEENKELAGLLYFEAKAIEENGEKTYEYTEYRNGVSDNDKTLSLNDFIHGNIKSVTSSSGVNLLYRGYPYAFYPNGEEHIFRKQNCHGLELIDGGKNIKVALDGSISGSSGAYYRMYCDVAAIGGIDKCRFAPLSGGTAKLKTIYLTNGTTITPEESGLVEASGYYSISERSTPGLFSYSPFTPYNSSNNSLAGIPQLFAEKIANSSDYLHEGLTLKTAGIPVLVGALENFDEYLQSVSLLGINGLMDLEETNKTSELSTAFFDLLAPFLNNQALDDFNFRDYPMPNTVFAPLISD